MSEAIPNLSRACYACGELKLDDTMLHCNYRIHICKECLQSKDDLIVMLADDLYSSLLSTERLLKQMEKMKPTSSTVENQE